MKTESVLIMIVVLYSCIPTVKHEDLRILGGSDTTTKTFPFYVSAIFYKKGVVNGVCGATYISRLWVLTAAHCVSGMDFARLAMELDLFTDWNTSIIQKRNSSRLIAHPNYNKINPGFSKDVALIKLPSPFDITEKAKLAALAANPICSYDDDCSVTLIGYGKTDIYGMSGISEKLQMIVVPVWNRYDCKYSIINKDAFCVGKQGELSCRGDSGGAAIYRGVVAGITSFGMIVDNFTCATPFSIYEDVSKHLRWIRRYVRDIKTSTAQGNRVGEYVIWVSPTIEILSLVSILFNKYL